MKLKDRVAIIEEKNMCRLLNLYGKIKDIDELSTIINNHLEVAIDEIEEDGRRQKKEIVTKKKRYQRVEGYKFVSECISDYY